MLHGLLTLPIILPVVFWSIYHYHKDRHLPEPPVNLLLCFGFGLLAYSLLAIGPIEELAKLVPFLIFVRRFRAFDEPLDGIIERAADRGIDHPRHLDLAAETHARAARGSEAGYGGAGCSEISRTRIHLAVRTG